MLEVRRCIGCQLLYRYPKAPQTDAFYQEAYEEFERGLVTTLPTVEDLAVNLLGTPWDSSRRLSQISQLGAHGRLLDFGCSWGYLVAQARRHGLDAFGFEISLPRARFGREHLGVEILDQQADLDRLPAESVDMVYASHVLEHLAHLSGVFDGFARLLRPGGLLLILVPNCAGANARRLGVGWGPFTNEAHPISFEPVFFERNLTAHGFTVHCDSDAAGQSGDELVVVARKAV